MTILSTCLDLLVDHGPLPLEELATLAAGAGVTRARDPAAAVRGTLAGRPGQVLIRDDDVCVAVRTLLSGRVFTHRLTSEERSSDRLRTGTDLELLRGAAHDGLPLRSGKRVRSESWSGGLLGPAAWLREHEAGATLALRVLPEGLDVREVTIGVAEQTRGRALAATLPPRHRDSWPPVGRGGMTRALLLLLDADPDLLRDPVPPLGEVLGGLDAEDEASGYRRWPDPRAIGVGEDTSGVLRHAAGDLGVDPHSLADALLCALLSEARDRSATGAASGSPPPRGAGERELQWHG